MIHPQFLLDLHDELIVDLFAGGGGASCGIEMGLGRQVDVAINHSKAAVEMHRENHPQTHHEVADVFEVPPASVTKGRPVGLLWASPDCTFHSKARGGKPIRSKERRRRALAWVVTRWAGQVRPRVIMLENVEEFVDWGPLVGPPSDLKPDPRRKGETFRKWVRSLKRHGYEVDWRELRGCDYGAPTIRKRLFLIARCDGQPIVWPEPTHGDPKVPGFKRSGLKPWRTAADCIDWSLPMCSIFATKEEARAWAKEHGQGVPVRPLAENTMKRIARGTMRYVVENPEPYIVPLTHHGNRRGHPMGEPMPTVTAAHRGELALVAPTLVQSGYGERDGQAPRSLDIKAPLGTAVGSQKHALVAGHLSTYYGEKRDGDARGAALDEPLRTQTTENRHAIVAAHMTKFAENSIGESPDEPLHTVMAGAPRHGIVAAYMAQHNGGFYDGAGRPADAPLSTITGRGTQQQIVSAGLVKLRGTSSVADIQSPLHTVTADGKHHGVVAAHLTHNYTSNTGGGQGDPEKPIKTIVSGGQHAALVYAFLVKYYGQGIGQEAGEPLHTIPTLDRFSVVTVMVDRVAHYIADLLMRMLQPRELYRCQGFPDSYIIDHAGGRKLTKTEQVQMVGNSVCPQLACALARANVPQMVLSRAA